MSLSRLLCAHDSKVVHRGSAEIENFNKHLILSVQKKRFRLDHDLNSEDFYVPTFMSGKYSLSPSDLSERHVFTSIYNQATGFTYSYSFTINRIALYGRSKEKFSWKDVLNKNHITQLLITRWKSKSRTEIVYLKRRPHESNSDLSHMKNNNDN